MPTWERGRPARMHRRHELLSTPTMWQPATFSNTHRHACPLEEQERRKETPHPGTRASRPHALPSRAAQYAYDVAAGDPTASNAVCAAEAGPWRVCRSTRVEEMGQAVPRHMRARRPRSQVGPARDVIAARNLSSTAIPLHEAPRWASRSGRNAPSAKQRSPLAIFNAQNPAIFDAH